jgi:hypothetical protein
MTSPIEDPVKPKRRRARAGQAAEEALLGLTNPIANWQAKCGWHCAMWGLIPFAGLLLGVLALMLGALGYLRVRRCPDDLGIRHAVGSLILGSIEMLVNVAGIGCIVKGVTLLANPAR